MPNKNPIQKPIEKPWAVYSQPYPLIVKIVQDAREGVDVLNSETTEYFAMAFLNHKNLIRFSNPNKAIEYFCRTYGDSKEKTIQMFLENFPSERDNLEKLLAQSQPKLIEQPPRRIDAMEPGYSEPND